MAAYSVFGRLIGSILQHPIRVQTETVVRGQVAVVAVAGGLHPSRRGGTATMTESIILPRKRSKLLRALIIGFFLALAAWAVTFLSFAVTSATVEIIGNALRPGRAVADWLVGVSNDPYKSAGRLLLTEFVANWMFYAGVVLVVNLIINVLHRNVPGGRGQAE
jgi:hypothetical protein